MGTLGSVPERAAGLQQDTRLLRAGVRAGNIRALSGASGALQWHLAAPDPNTYLGSALARGADLGADGVAGVIVTAALPRYTPPSSPPVVPGRAIHSYPGILAWRFLPEIVVARPWSELRFGDPWSPVALREDYTPPVPTPAILTEPNMPTQTIDKQHVVRLLNSILEMELAGVVRYTHYSLMVFGYSRIPIVSWLRSQADESMGHATKAGELVTILGEHPSLSIGPLLETHNHDIGAILREAMDHERATLKGYHELLTAVEGRSVMLEEYAREMIYAEEMHLGEVDKMLRNPGQIGAFDEAKSARK